MRDWMRWLSGSLPPAPSEDYGSAHDGADGPSSNAGRVDHERQAELEAARVMEWGTAAGRVGHAS